MIPDYCEALTAYRCWNVFPNGLMVGQAHAEPWPPFAPFVGRCGYASSADHVVHGRWMPAPVYRCDCGVHALKSSEHAEQRLITEVQAAQSSWVVPLWEDYRAPKGRVWGAVKVWGRVIEHAIGYRAEFAYPSALFCEDEKLASIVAALYGVPCEVKKLAIPEPQHEDRYGYHSYQLGSSYYITSSPLTAPPLTTQPVFQPSMGYLLSSTPYQKKQSTQQAADKAAADAAKWDLIQKYLGNAKV